MNTLPSQDERPALVTRRGKPPRARWAVASRVFVAVFGGYALTALASVTIARVSTAAREEAVAQATTPAYLLWMGAILWAFAARTAGRAWAGIGLPTLILAVIEIWIRKQGSS